MGDKSLRLVLTSKHFTFLRNEQTNTEVTQSQPSTAAFSAPSISRRTFYKTVLAPAIPKVLSLLKLCPRDSKMAYFA